MVCYWIFILLKGLRHISVTGSYDWEGTIYECFNAWGLPSLFFKEEWTDIPLWVNLETLMASGMILAGGILGFRSGGKRFVAPHRSKYGRHEESAPKGDL
jgi:hypothetical protein